MNPYFIASLPRSRTAWLANFLTTGPCYCFHEPMNKVDPEDYPRLLSSVGTRYCGISDSLNSLIMEQLIDMFPDARVVVIRRPVEEVAHSLEVLGIKCPAMLEKMDRALDKIECSYGALRIEYDFFDAPRIWKFLVPDYPLNRVRLEMLDQFNITVPKEVFTLKAIELMTRAGDLLWPLIR